MSEFDLDPEQIAPTDRAFIASASHEFLGEKLKPSIARQIAAQAMGNRLLCGTAQIVDSLPYPGLFADVVALIYLCRASEQEVTLAVMQPARAMQKALAWAEAADIAQGSANYLAARDIYSAILHEWTAAQFHVEKVREGTESKNAPGGPLTAA